MVKEEKPKVEGGSKPKGGRFQKSYSTWKACFKAPTAVLEDEVFDFGKQKHAAYLVKNCEAISKYIVVNYYHVGTEMSMSINKIYKPMINVSEVPDDTFSRAEIFIW